MYALVSAQERLDRLGARKAAAHLDAAIEQLRRDIAAMSMMAGDGSETTESTSKSEASNGDHVVPRKASTVPLG
jgi:hypothetical protein